LNHLREATRLDPSHADAAHNFAVALAQAGDVDGAVKAAERACALAPNDAKSAGLMNELRRLARR
jgi:Flp pilus assembly protein TadD